MLEISINMSWFAQRKTAAFQGPVGVAISHNIQLKNFNVVGDSFLDSPDDDTSLTACRNTTDLFLRASVFIIINHLKLVVNTVFPGL